MKSLDLANKELLEALEGSQEEIERLSMEGMRLMGKYRELNEMYQRSESVSTILRDEINALKSSNDTSSKHDLSVLNEQVAALQALVEG